MTGMGRCGWLLGIFCFLSTMAMAGEPLSVRADAWPPFNDRPGTVKGGYMIEVLWEIFPRQGVPIDYKLMSWDESLAVVRKGQFNAVVGADKSDAPGFIFPKEAFGMSGTAFFVRQDNPWRFSGISSLKEVRLGVVEGYAYNDALDSYIRKQKETLRVVAVSGENPAQELLKLLLSGKIDVIAEDTNVVQYAAINFGMPPGRIVRAGVAEDESPVYIAFSPHHPRSRHLAEMFDQGIRELRASGKLQAILQRYGLKDWGDPVALAKR